MKKYSLDFSLVRSESGEEIWNRSFIHIPSDDNITIELKDILESESGVAASTIEKDTQGPYTLGHLRVASLVGRALEHVDKAITMHPSTREHKIIAKSDCDFSTNYKMILTINEIVPEKPRNRIIERFSRLLRGE